MLTVARATLGSVSGVGGGQGRTLPPEELADVLVSRTDTVQVWGL